MSKPLEFNQLSAEQGFVIGETACGHEGELSKLKQLIEAIAEGGAQAVKFQMFVPLERATKDHHEWDIFNKLALSLEDWQQAAEYAREKGLLIFADIFGEEGFAMAKSIQADGYKIHSEDLLNSYFIAQVAAEEKLTMIGVGGAHRIEIYNLVNFLKERDLLKNIVLMTGVQTFPTPLEAHSLSEVSDLIEKYASFGIKVGFSDHVSGDLQAAKILPLLALAKGAVMIEKHITINRDDEWEDYQSALDKTSFKDFMSMIKSYAPLLNPVYELNDYELQYRKTFKKSPVAVKDLNEGTKFTDELFKFVKHAKDSVPLSGMNLADRQLKRPLQKDQIIRTSDLKESVGGIIVARCSSNRLPSKATRCILERETIALLIERIKRCQNLDKVILATSTDPSDDILETIAKREGILPFRGSLENLSQRFFEAAKHYGVNQIVRITGDDILRDEVMIDQAVESHLEASCDVTFMNNMPYGTSSEIFSLNALETILKTVSVSSHTEYLEWYLQNSRYFSINYVTSDYQYDPSLRLTLDYEEDFLLFKAIFEHFENVKKNFTLKDTLNWLKENPDVATINNQKNAKYTRQDLDVTLKI